MRENDIIGRLGGEEFAVIVPESIEFAARIAERLRAGFAEAGVTIGGHAIGATVSIGAATSCDPEADIHGLLARADAALYRAKHDGRNRVCIDDTLPPSRKTGLAAGEHVRTGAFGAGQGPCQPRQIGAVRALSGGDGNLSFTLF